MSIIKWNRGYPTFPGINSIPERDYPTYIGELEYHVDRLAFAVGAIKATARSAMNMGIQHPPVPLGDIKQTNAVGTQVIDGSEW